ncbi:unnamed protein product [Rhizophagus irregularis]|uniref:Uncharacterized protein n=1 Tax=Rhizophagus irregularis TaxID=588596 RepID=A0A916E059_9GLOM|nr:unnamed protein product [Rhizophagus irregularis]CAB4475305.1 unnamed protein product [Rhizophagus irregularis]CAB5331144.1 unnamed protein product [Rhizophagus irregularis]
MPYLVGSRPPSYDFLWKYVEKEGFEVENFDRDRQNHEKEVDSEIACAMIQTSLLNEPGTIVLISGISTDLKKKATFIHLGGHYKYFTYGYGSDEMY